jgi:hypothetical protein
MSGGLDLEQRYRRVLRLLPGYYRDTWEEDMVAAFLDGWLTGDPDEDSVTMEYDRPSRAEIASVVGLAARLYLGGAGAPRRYFAWGQAVRGTVLALLLVHAVLGLDGLMVMAGTRQLAGYLPAPFSSIWTSVWYVAYYTWILTFVALVLGHYRAARVIVVLAIIPDLAGTLQAQVTGTIQAPYFSWAFCVLLVLAPVLAMAAFHRDAPPVARGRWLLALPATFVLVVGPLLAARPAGLSAWLPDFPGLCCMLVSLLCLAHAPRAWSSRADSDVWSLTLLLLGAVAGAFRIASLGDYVYDYVYAPHLIGVGLVELLILAAAVALVAPDAARAQAAVPAPPPYPHPGLQPR